MATKRKSVNNGNGTDLTISEGRYLSVGKDGMDVTVRAGGKMVCFNIWDDMVAALDVSKAAYVHHDHTKGE